MHESKADSPLKDSPWLHIVCFQPPNDMSCLIHPGWKRLRAVPCDKICWGKNGSVHEGNKGQMLCSFPSSAAVCSVVFSAMKCPLAQTSSQGLGWSRPSNNLQHRMRLEVSL